MALYSCDVRVLRSGEGLKKVNSRELVPGDVVEIPDMCFMPCDIIMLTGSSIVNESMLTGESIPVIKNAIPNTHETYDPLND